MRFIVVIEYDVPPDVNHPPGLGLTIHEPSMTEGVSVVRCDALIREPADEVAEIVADSSGENDG